MSGAGLGWSIFGAVMLVGVLLTRPFYGRIRAFCIDDAVREGYMDPIKQIHENDLAVLMGLTALASFFWPVGLLVIYAGPALLHYAGGSKYKSKYELAEEAKANSKKMDELRDKILELEREEWEWRRQ